MILFKPKLSNLWKSFSEPESTPSRFNSQKMHLNDFLKESEKEFRLFLGPTINLRYSLAANLPDLDADP